ncbi:MAG TPA: hypothetical protein VG125_12280 [Pirellulales bacterium]|jgi:hypothetical protein|nr:hypothetical protein [Pirellulales bacterium]
MNRRLAVWATGGLFALGLGLLAWGYWAARRVPPFYAAAVSVPLQVHREASDHLLESAAALASNVQKEGQWQAIFTSEQINGWLATGLNETFPGLLPDYVVDPRVTVGADGVLFGCRYLKGNVETVVSLKAELFVSESNVLKVRLRHARAGAFPLPLGNVLEGVTRVATDLSMQLSWLQADGDPVAVIRLHPADDRAFYHLEKLRLGDNEVFVAGYTVPRESDGSPAAESHDKPLAAVPSGTKENRQR